MAPVINQFWATPKAQRHMLDEHGVFFEEAEEAAESTDRFGRTDDPSGQERRYIAAGKTSGGQRLWVIFADQGAGVGRIITAFEPEGRKGIARHKKQRGD